MAARSCSCFPGHPGTAQPTSGGQRRIGPHRWSAESCRHPCLRQAPKRGAPVSVLTPTAPEQLCAIIPPAQAAPTSPACEGTLLITGGRCTFAPHLFTGYFKGNKVPRETLQRVCSAAGHVNPLLCSPSRLAPGPRAGGSPLARCRHTEFWGLLQLGVSILLSSALTKLLFWLLSRLRGRQGEKIKTVQDAPSFASSKGVSQHGLCPPLQALPCQQSHRLARLGWRRLFCCWWHRQ